MANTVGIEAIVEVDENERYWVGKGFVKGGLLPNDRGAFSTTDGSLAWKTIEEVSEDLLLLGRGWVYKEDGFSPTQKDDPDNCWLYATDFRAESINQAKPSRGVLHWIRFRRLNRIKVFNPGEFVPKDIYEQCDFGDSDAADALSKIMLEVLAYSTLLHNKTHVTDTIALQLKKSILDIAIGYHLPKGETDAFYQLDQLRKKLENFVEKERSHTMMSRLFSGIDFSFYGRIGRKEFKERCDAVSASCLLKIERDAIASLIVRKLDPHFQVHCDKVNCGDECGFTRVKCPNEGCSTTMSKIYLETHDATCPYKIITCDCGDTFPTNESSHHLGQVCRLRSVECPFTNIGCLKVVKACDSQKHVADDVCAHLLLAVNRIVEQQEEMKDTKSKIMALEQDNKELKLIFQKQQEASAKEVAHFQTKLTKTSKELGHLETTCKKEFKKINDHRSHVK